LQTNVDIQGSTATSIFGWLDKLAQNGGAWPLVCIFLVAFGVIAYVAYKAYKTSKKESHEQNLALVERMKTMQDEQREDNVRREEYWKEERSAWREEREATMTQLSKFNDSLSSINITMGTFSTLFERMNDDMRDLKIIVSK